eukprot:1161521-Pelagomonas_calceolata.AAC.5
MARSLIGAGPLEMRNTARQSRQFYGCCALLSAASLCSTTSPQANRHRLLSIFESMKEIADEQEAEQRAMEEHACRIIQVCALSFWFPGATDHFPLLCDALFLLCPVLAAGSMSASGPMCSAWMSLPEAGALCC